MGITEAELENMPQFKTAVQAMKESYYLHGVEDDFIAHLLGLVEDEAYEAMLGYAKATLPFKVVDIDIQNKWIVGRAIVSIDDNKNMLRIRPAYDTVSGKQKYSGPENMLYSSVKEALAKYAELYDEE